MVSVMRVAVVMATLLAASALHPASNLTVDPRAREVRISATVHPRAMERPFGVQGHHAVVWEGGKSRWWALFVAQASDHDVRAALDSLGAKRGENLTPATWNAREDARSVEPDKRVDGSPVEVFVEWNRKRVPLASVLRQRGHAHPQLDFRYGGHERWQKEFESGCIVCLYSCPGGAIGNHARTIRDSVRHGVVYASVPERLPRAGSKVTIVLKVREPE